MTRFLTTVPSGKSLARKPSYLLTVIFVLILDLLNKDPKKRMFIKDVLEHVWIQKQTKNKLTEIRRSSKEKNVSTFKMYTTVEEKDK